MMMGTDHPDQRLPGQNVIKAGDERSGVTPGSEREVFQVMT